MAKRFTDTEKWKDSFFQDLSGKMQLFYFYVLDNCDCAGIWKVNFRHFEFCTGFKITKKEIEECFSGKMTFTIKGDLFILNFIRFQYGNLNSEKSNIHKGVIKALDYHGLQTNPYPRGLEDYSKGSGTLQDKNKDMDMDMDMDMNKNNTDDISDYKQHQKNRSNAPIKKKVKFDLDILYATYPRKEGKKQGMVRLERIVTSQEKFDQVHVAIKNYSDQCKGKEIKFIKQFSSFISVWEDYLIIEKTLEEIQDQEEFDKFDLIIRQAQAEANEEI